MQVLQTFAERHYVANSLRCLEVASGSYGSLPDVVSPSESPPSNHGLLARQPYLVGRSRTYPSNL